MFTEDLDLNWMWKAGRFLGFPMKVFSSESGKRLEAVVAQSLWPILRRSSGFHLQEAEGDRGKVALGRLIKRAPGAVLGPQAGVTRPSKEQNAKPDSERAPKERRREKRMRKSGTDVR